jgi:hypothetical protein
MNDSALEAFREGGDYDPFQDSTQRRTGGGSNFFGSLVAEPIIEEESHDFPNSSPEEVNNRQALEDSRDIAFAGNESHDFENLAMRD